MLKNTISSTTGTMISMIVPSPSSQSPPNISEPWPDSAMKPITSSGTSATARLMISIQRADFIFGLLRKEYDAFGWYPLMAQGG